LASGVGVPMVVVVLVILMHTLHSIHARDVHCCPLLMMKGGGDVFRSPNYVPTIGRLLRVSVSGWFPSLGSRAGESSDGTNMVAAALRLGYV
jgi:hypothetical protein